MISLDEIEARANAATPGPWKPCGASAGKCVCGLVWSQKVDGVVAIAQRDAGDFDFRPEEITANQHFIAHAREDVPALVAAVRERDDTIDAMRACPHGDFHHNHGDGCPSCTMEADK